MEAVFPTCQWKLFLFFQLLFVVSEANNESSTVIRFCCMWDKFCYGNDTQLLEKLESANGSDSFSEVEILRGNPCIGQEVFQERHNENWGFFEVCQSEFLF
jgi:hypothetical protein